MDDINQKEHLFALCGGYRSMIAASIIGSSFCGKISLKQRFNGKTDVKTDSKVKVKVLK
jgi:hypothetical protein